MTQPWPYDPINTHVDDALGRFTSQYDDMPVMQGVTRVFAERMQALEGSAYELLTQRWINTAQGEQLDRIGETVGEFRMARGDEAYRAAIKVRIGLNQGSGQPEVVIFVMRQLLETAVYRERYPAGILIETQNEPVTLEQQQGIVSVTPAGVSVAGVSTLHTGPTIRYGIGQLIATNTRVNPYFTGLIDDHLPLGPATAAGGTTVAGVMPVLPDPLQQQTMRVNRAIAHGGTSVVTVAPFGVYLVRLGTEDGDVLAYTDGQEIYAYVTGSPLA